MKLKHEPALDGLRAIAASAVLLDHAKVPGFSGGGLGVDVFFALSGFLITGLLLNEWQATGSLNLARFWLRRLLRLYPALAAMVAAACLLHFATLAQAAPALLYYANWQRALVHDIGALGHTWSLAAEEQFYLLWPLVLLLMLRAWGARVTMWAALAAAGLIILTREVAFQAHLLPYARLYNGFDFRSDGLLLGSATALALHTRALPDRLRSPRLRLAAIGLLAFVFAGREVWGAPSFLERPVAALATLAVILGALDASAPRLNALLSFPAIRWLGVRSYALYLWHYPVCQALPGDTAGLMIAKVALSVGAAALCYLWVERPFLIIKDKISLPLRPKSSIQQSYS